MRRVVVIGALLIAAAGLALAVAPFARRGTIRDFVTAGGTPYNLSRDCLPPIVSAVRHDAPHAYGDAPVSGTFLSPNPPPGGPVTLRQDCRQAGANRLAVALTLEVAAGALAVVRRRPRLAGTATTIAPA